MGLSTHPWDAEDQLDDHHRATRSDHDRGNDPTTYIGIGGRLYDADRVPDPNDEED